MRTTSNEVGTAEEQFIDDIFRELLSSILQFQLLYGVLSTHETKKMQHHQFFRNVKFIITKVVVHHYKGGEDGIAMFASVRHWI